ncbi:ATP-binding protein [Actinomadura sp. NBRC 104425]|uniref:ATP-binding protein n=1 Tax=Actinomadura sp. NBRC 104425 TaxID=3032204 RepID=UPI0025536004|nr:ATP-binding protein [Actinomadura sp. NBRC 104425]
MALVERVGARYRPERRRHDRGGDAVMIARIPLWSEHPAALPASDLWRARVWRLSSQHAERKARAVVRDALTRAGASADTVADMELVVAELAANAVQHAKSPYELRIIFAGVDSRAVWCEVADCDPSLGRIPELLNVAAVPEPDDDLDAVIASLTVGGRGLALVHGLTAGRCAVYPTTVCSPPRPGKAIGFALL